MHLATLDWVIILSFLGLSLLLGLYFSKKAARSIDDYFISGRSLPWWLAGVSMVATAFAIDTPLGVTGLVAGRGIQGMWFAWASIMGGAGVFGAFVFAQLLRRSRIVTLAELIELRYSGRPASALRIFKAVYMGILANAITLGWVIKAVYTVCQAILPAWDPNVVLGAILAFTLVYTALAGMWGIAATDVIQYCISTVGSVMLAVFAMKHVGGIDGITSGFVARYGAQEGMERLSFLPTWGTDFFVTFVVFMTLKWWVDTPGAITQRILASKNERHASGATFFFATVHFALNYWPMILVALVSLVVYPELKSPELGYPMLIVKLLPTGFLGLMLAAMMAAFMSTIDTHINMGASYIVKDLYQRFLHPGATEHHYIWASRVATVLMLAFAVFIALNLESVKDGWYFLTLLLSGYGFVVVVRWFWWRVNAWSEISALLGSLTASMIMQFVVSPRVKIFQAFGPRFTVVFVFCTIVWVTVTLLTKPCDEERLVDFCRKVKPFPWGWGPIVRKYPDLPWSPNLGLSVFHFVCGAVMIFGLCFGVGHFLFTHYLSASLLGVLSASAGLTIAFTWRHYETYETPDAA